MRYNFYFLLLLNLSLHSNEYVIGCSSAGLFAIFFRVLNHLDWCERNNKIPIIYWGNNCLYYQTQGYNNCFNVWEYYFYPVSNAKYSKDLIVYDNFFAPDGTGIQYNLFNGIQMINYKNWANKIIKKYIKIKPNIAEKINNFYKLNLENKKTIGIHLRGTDKFVEVKPVDPMIIINEANKFNGYQYYIATDEEKLLELAKKNLKGKVIYYNCERSKNSSPIHINSNENNKALRGEEALIEAILLSKCDKIIHTHSNLSIAAHYFNPNLEAILFVHDKEPQLIK